jgi:nitrogen fixation protein NifU and related proteins
MSELESLYQETILDHGRRPRNFGKPDAFTHTAEGYNPLCGDRFTVYLSVVDGVIEDAQFDGMGCAISTASASLMTGALKGSPVSAFEATFVGFRGLVMGEPATEGLGKLVVFGGVSKFPMRVKCASLAWHTSGAALAGKPEATTE